MYEIDEIANMFPKTSEIEQLALYKNIELSGQKDPIALWQGRIIDGRSRYTACLDLDIQVKYIELPDEMPKEEVIKFARSANRRRNHTETQKLACAYKDQLNNGGTNKNVAEYWAVSVRSLQNFKYIAQHRPQFVDPLFDGKSIVITEPNKGHDITTNKTNTIAKIIRDIKDKEKEVVAVDPVDIKYSVEEIPLTSKMYPWYQEKLGEYGSYTPEGKEAAYKCLLIELAKHKEV